MVTFYQFVREALLRMSGATRAAAAADHPRMQPPSRSANAPGRTEFQRGIATRDADGVARRATGPQSSGVLQFDERSQLLHRARARRTATSTQATRRDHAVRRPDLTASRSSNVCQHRIRLLHPLPLRHTGLHLHEKTDLVHRTGTDRQSTDPRVPDVFSVPIVLLGVLVAFVRYGSVELSTVFSALLLNAILGFILLWIACHAYNWVASRFGGIEILLYRRAGRSMMPATIRAAAPADVGAIFALDATNWPNSRSSRTCSPRPKTACATRCSARAPSIEALVAESEGRIVGYALFFHNYSSFVGKRGLYLEDLYVQPAACAAAVSAPRCCSTSRRLRWSANAAASNGPCSTGTQHAIGFYEKMGATVSAGLAHRAADGRSAEQLALAPSGTSRPRLNRSRCRVTRGMCSRPALLLVRLHVRRASPSSAARLLRPATPRHRASLLAHLAACAFPPLRSSA